MSKKKTNTHLVWKNADISEVCSPEDLRTLAQISTKIKAYREMTGREAVPEYIVVNKDEGYADIIEQVIEDCEDVEEE